MKNEMNINIYKLFCHEWNIFIETLDSYQYESSHEYLLRIKELNSSPKESIEPQKPNSK